MRPHLTHVSFFDPKPQLEHSWAIKPRPKVGLPHLMQSSFFDPKLQLEHSCAMTPRPKVGAPHLMQSFFLEPKPQLEHNWAIAPDAWTVEIGQRIIAVAIAATANSWNGAFFERICTLQAEHAGDFCAAGGELFASFLLVFSLDRIVDLDLRFSARRTDGEPRAIFTQELQHFFFR